MTERKVVMIVHLNSFQYKLKELEWGRQIKGGVEVRLEENEYVKTVSHKESVTMR